MTNKDAFIEWLAACPVKYLRQDDWYEAHEDEEITTYTFHIEKGDGESIKEAALSDKYMIEGDDDAYLKHDYRKGEGA